MATDPRATESAPGLDPVDQAALRRTFTAEIEAMSSAAAPHTV